VTLAGFFDGVTQVISGGLSAAQFYKERSA